MHGLAVYVNEGLPFAQTYHQKTLQIYTYVFDLIYLTQCLTYFSSIDNLLCLYAQFLILFHLTQALSVSPSANVFVFGDLNIDHKEWPIYSGGNDRPCELCYNSSFSNSLTH